MEKTTYEEYLEKHNNMVYRNVGVSMLPLLKQGRDIFTIEKKTEERCKKYDVVLYRRPPSSYVLHRIIKVNPDDYTILGDNCINKEYGIKDEDIIGVMISFKRKGKDHKVTEIGYKLYSRIWYYIYPVRMILKKIKLKIKHLVKPSK